MAVRDNVNRIRENIHTDIPSQFPAVYQEDAPLFVEFMKAYYQYVDEQLPKFRDGFYARNVDTTDFDKFLLFFKNKYMADMPFDASTDIRFLIKHITDFYRRKGTEESLRLFFRMFFDEEVELFYPSTAILKPSDSKFGSNFYLEMAPVKRVQNYPIVRGMKIRGDSSKAEAFVDNVIFKSFSGSIVPIVFISALTGRFVSDDSIEGTDTNDSSITINVGRVINGSIDGITIKEAGRSAYNQIGDEVLIVSSESGVMGKGVVTDVSQTTTGIIDFKVEDSGYGYAVELDGVANLDLNTHLISNQVLVTNGTYDIQQFDNIVFVGVDVFYNDGTPVPNYSSFDAYAQVLFYEGSLVFANVLTPDIPVIPIGAYFEGVNGRTGETIRFVQSSEHKTDAQFKVQTLKNTENVTLIPDIIGDYLSVQLDSTDYGMTGSGAETINTTLRDAFTPKTYKIGEIDKILIIDSGIEYRNDVRSIVTMPEITNFDKRDLGMIFDRVDFLLEAGNIITQEIQIEDLTYQQPTVSYTVKLEFVRREENIFYFRQKSFYGLDEDLPVNIKGDTYNIVKVFEDDNSEPMGSNGVVSGRAFFAQGQIKNIRVTETGFKYRDGETVTLVNNNPDSPVYGNDVATAEISSRGMGYTRGRWTTNTSALNDSTKVIRDNYYYQEYSYDISSIVNPNKYESLVREEVAPAGTKLFSSPLINSFNTFETNSDIRIEVYTLNDTLYQGVNGEPVQAIQARFFAGTNNENPAIPNQDIQVSNAVLVEDETNRINEQINS